MKVTESFVCVCATLAAGDECPKSIGWEKNSQGKLAPREIDLAPLMDPLRCVLAADSQIERKRSSTLSK